MTELLICTFFNVLVLYFSPQIGDFSTEPVGEKFWAINNGISNNLLVPSIDVINVLSFDLYSISQGHFW